MASTPKGAGAFTTENIVALLHSIPDTDGSSAKVAAQDRERGSTFAAPASTLATKPSISRSSSTITT